jgi:hypothetical protein
MLRTKRYTALSLVLLCLLATCPLWLAVGIFEGAQGALRAWKDSVIEIWATIREV